MSETPLLDGLLGPADLRRLDDSQLHSLAKEIRHRLKTVVSQTGGHLSSNLGVVELTLALHRVFDFSSDRLLWDVGHQAYVHKLLTGRQAAFASNRQAGGLSGFPDPQESSFDLAKVGHSSTAISTGVGLAEAYRVRQQDRKTVVVVGDGALTGGMSFEGLINAGEHSRNLLVVLNDNGAFIDAPVGSLHRYLAGIRSGTRYQLMRKRIKNLLGRVPGVTEMAHAVEHAVHRLLVPGHIFEELGLRYFGPVDGHDRVAVEDALRASSSHREPVLLHVITQKGGGWQPAQDDPLAFHGPRHFDVESGIFQKRPAVKTYSDVLAETLADLAAEDPTVVAITAAMPSGTGLRAFAQRFPERCHDVGICEQHSFAFAQGLRLGGLRPMLCHYSTFAQRGFDQLFQEFVVQRTLGITLTLDRAGLVGEDGETHHGLYDIAWARCLPGTVLCAPKDGLELRDFLRWAHEAGASANPAAAYIVRYPKEALPTHRWGLRESEPIMLGKAQLIQQAQETGGLALWAYGAGVRLAWEALALLSEEQARCITLVNARFAKPLDLELLQAHALSHSRVLTLEDHSVVGGFGAAVLESLASLELSVPVTVLGVRDELVPHATREQQLAAQGLSAPSLAERLSRLLATHAAPLRFPRVANGA